MDGSHGAAWRGSVNLIKVLTDRRLNVNNKSTKGLRFLHMATQGEQGKGAEILLGYGADLSAATSINGWRLCTMQQSLDIVQR